MIDNTSTIDDKIMKWRLPGKGEIFDVVQLTFWIFNVLSSAYLINWEMECHQKETFFLNNVSSLT